MIAAMVLITSQGYIHLHSTRTGDYDALMAFFTTVYALSFFLFLESTKKKYLHIFVISLTLAVLTKSIQALIFLPALFIFLVQQKKLGFFRSKWFFIDAFLCILVIGGYYLTREHYNPGYLQAVWDNEIVGRYATTLENHKADFFYYIDFITGWHFGTWYWLVPCGMVLGFLFKDEKFRKITIFTSLLVITYWLVISGSSTKLEWYDVPLFPFLAMIVAIAIYFVFMLFQKSLVIPKILKTNLVPMVFLFAVFLAPYRQIINKVYKPIEYDGEEDFYRTSYYLRDALNMEHNVKDHFICFAGEISPVYFYVNLLNDKNMHVSFKDWNNLQQGDLVIAGQKNVKTEIEKKYEVEITEDVNKVRKYKIFGRKGN